MADAEPTREQLLQELEATRRRLAEAEAARERLTAANVRALRESEERLRLAVRGGNLGFWDFYPQTGDCYFDERWFSMLGYSFGELESTVATWEGLLHPEDKPRVLGELQRHFNDPSARYEVEFRLRTKSGDYTWILAKGEAILRDEEGKPLRMAGTHLDVGERRLAQERATRFHRLLSRSRHEIYVFSATSLRLLEVNHGACENLGYSPAELQELTPLDLKPEFTPETFAELLEPLRAGELEARRFETEHERKNGSRYPVEVSLELASEPPVFVAVVLDISERKQAEAERRRLEEQLKRAQRLESLGILASGLAHDFNNLLLGIQGNTELAHGVLGEQSPARRFLQRAETATRRAAELVKQMLACAGAANAEVEEFDLNEIVRELAILLGASVSKKTRIALELADGALLMRGDPTQIRRIVVNLITNADQALGAESGTVTVATQRLEATRELLDALRPDEALPEGSYLSLTISDTGCGIPEDVRERIFDPFFTTKPTGSGLGLSAVHGIVRSHAGALELESESSRGTTFRILLPAAGSAAASAATEDPSSWTGSGTVLIVDDEDLVREFATDAVELLGFKTLSVSSGSSAIEVFRERHAEVACVLLDSKMPDLDGEETFAELRRIRPDVPVVLCSGLLSQELRGRLASQGFAGFMQKPYGVDALRASLREALAQGRST